MLGGVCQNECDTGLLRTWVHVCNGGLASAAGVTTIHAIVRDASGDHDLAQVPVDVDLDVGDCTVGVPIDLPAEPVRSAQRVIFRLAHDLDADCQRGNEEVWLEGPQCP